MKPDSRKASKVNKSTNSSASTAQSTFLTSTESSSTSNDTTSLNPRLNKTDPHHSSFDLSLESLNHPIFVGGPAYSGKSRLVCDSFRETAETTVIGTADIDDPGFKKHLLNLQADRRESWNLVEEPIDIAHAIDDAAETSDLVILDSVNQWLGNLFKTSMQNYDQEQFLGYLQVESNQLIMSIKKSVKNCDLIVISSEQGSSLSPKSPEERLYRQCLGRLNQQLAAACESAVHVVYGIPTFLKGNLQ